MGLANKFNTNARSTVKEGIDTKSLQYMKAADIAFNEGDPIVIYGFIIQDGDFGKSVTLICANDIGINIPPRYVKMFEGLTDEEVEEVKAGKMGIKSITANVKTKKGTTTTLEFCDL